MRDPSEFEIQRVFPSQFRGTCVVNEAHRIRIGDRVARLQRADNPMLPVGGVACEKCWRGMEKARG